MVRSFFFIHGWPGTAITWTTQLDAFASVGFRAITPDISGYGQSTARRVVGDYSQEAIVEGMIALLAHTRHDAAIWVGHDWGTGVVSSVARQYPQCVMALVKLRVPSPY
jgi:soluble epoxide hydrolase/lipid-phosphate phosphatase